MSGHFTTRNTVSVPGKQNQWRQAISETYFQLDVRFASHERFEGSLNSWQLGDITLSQLQSAPAAYLRLPQHLQHLPSEEAFLLTLPLDQPVAFSQVQRQIDCTAGNFLLELSHEPYHFSYAKANRLWVLKIPHPVISRHLHLPERYVAQSWSGRDGVGLLLQQYLHMCGQQLQYNTDPASRQLMGKQLLELFTHLVQQSEQRLLSPASDTRRAHLQRIKHYVRHHLDNPALDPHTVAAACHISVRYLHDLFGDTDTSFSQWLKQQRLATAHHLLTRPHFQQTLAALAYQVGFTDQANFSRAFKQAFGLSPKEVLQQQRTQTA